MTSLFSFALGIWVGVLACAAFVMACVYWKEGKKRDRI